MEAWLHKGKLLAFGPRENNFLKIETHPNFALISQAMTAFVASSGVGGLCFLQSLGGE